MWHNLLSIEFGPSWTKCWVTLKIKLGWSNRSKQKCYCKSNDPPWRIQEYPKLYVFFTGARTPISMSRRILNWKYFYTPLPNIRAAMTPIGVSNILSNRVFLKLFFTSFPIVKLIVHMIWFNNIFINKVLVLNLGILISLFCCIATVRSFQLSNSSHTFALNGVSTVIDGNLGELLA